MNGRPRGGQRDGQSPGTHGKLDCDAVASQLSQHVHGGDDRFLAGPVGNRIVVCGRYRPSEVLIGPGEIIRVCHTASSHHRAQSALDFPATAQMSQGLQGEVVARDLPVGEAPAMNNLDLVIRKAAAGDLLAVLRVHGHRDPGGVTPVVATPAQTVTWDLMLGRQGLTLYLAEIDGVAVGTATLLLLPNLTYDCQPSAFIEAVVVDVEFRRRGIATAIIQGILNDTAAAGCNKIQLLSHKRHVHDRAHQLYTGLGFEAEAEGFRLYQQRVPDAVAAAR
jgi:GNAT superfamily N-acetyltransferase